MTSTLRRIGIVTCLAAFVLSACGSDATESSSPIETDMDDMADHDMGDMGDMADHDMGDMGDMNATPADEVSGAVLARGTFVLMDTRPAGYDDVAGSAVIARSAAGTTITTELSGLLPNVDYIGHAHAKACNDDNAGKHYQFEIGGPEVPPNEIHLAFTSDADGNGFMTAENDQIAGADAVAFVVHPLEFIDNKIACVDFVEDEPGSIDALLAANS